MVDRDYLQYQFGDSEKLRIRGETHARYTEPPDRFLDHIAHQLRVRVNQLVLDVGCGHGAIHPLLRNQFGARIIGLDLSAGMVREARAAGDGMYVQGDAQALPVAEAAVDRGMANHVLFFVPDIDGALHEMRRVVRRGGRVVLTTNGPDFMRRFSDLHADALGELGLAPAPATGERFTLADLERVQRVFPTAELHAQDAALVFREAEPALRFYASGMVDRVADRPSDGSHRGPLLAQMRRRIESIIAAEGSFRVPKTVGWFTADV